VKSLQSQNPGGRAPNALDATPPTAKLSLREKVKCWVSDGSSLISLQAAKMSDFSFSAILKEIAESQLFVIQYELCELTPNPAKVQISSLNLHSAGIYTGTRYASIYVEKKKSPH
jgi:hypothetical protein